MALQHPELAAEQLEYAVNELNFRGASIGGHVLGESLTERRFDPFWAKAEELSAPIFMHPGGADNLLMEGALDRFPGLKLIGASQIVYGTDIPLFWPDTLDLVLDATHLSDAEKEAIVGGNLVEVLRVEA